MMFKRGTSLYSYEVRREGGENVIYINYLGAPLVPNLAESAEVMARTIDSLIESQNVSRIVFVQQRNYNYDFREVSLLIEIAQLYTYFVRQEKILSPEKLSFYNQDLGKRHDNMTYFLTLLKQDPIASYFEVRRFLREERQLLEKLPAENKADQMNYIRLLEKISSLMENLSLIKQGREYFSDYVLGDRKIYQNFFRSDVIPNFTFTRLLAELPEKAEIVDEYEIGEKENKTLVTILKKKDEPKYIYHLSPPEYTLEEDFHMLINLARNVLIEHRPKAEEFTDVERTRQTFFNISQDLLQELAESKGVNLSYNDLNKLAGILVRHTIGFGLIEILLQDKKLQDIVLNAPISRNPIFVRHSEFDECLTNIIPSYEDAESWAAKFRMLSGRPLDEANPVLDTDLSLGKIRSRVAIIQKPLSPKGLAYALRRHREEPWTLPLFVDNKMLNSFAAGLLSFLIDGSRTMLVAGTRSSGKCVGSNTNIQLSDGTIEKIKNLGGEKKRKIDDGMIYHPKIKMKVPCMDNLKLLKSEVTDVWKRESPEKIIKIKTRSGKEIITTKEHPYFVYQNGLKNKRADEIKEKDLIASPRELNIKGKDIFIDLKNKPYFYKETRKDFILKGKTNSSIVRFPKKVTEKLAEFIGLIIGDGHLDLQKLGLYNNCEEIRKKFIDSLKYFNIPYKEFKSRNTMVVQANSRTLNRILNEVFEISFGKKSNKVVIPEVILKSKNSVLKAFLRGYFDTDGYTNKEKRDIELVTASKEMSEQLRFVLLRFGIVSFVKKKKIKGFENPYFRILIRGDFVDKFAKKIGFFHPLKRTNLEKLTLRNYLQNTNIDTIPEGNKIVRELRKKFRVSSKQFRTCGKDYWAYENNQYRASRNWFKKIISFYNNRYKKLSSFGSQISQLKKFVRFNYEDYFRKIERLKTLLNLSYASLAVETGISETGMRKIIGKKSLGSLSLLNKLLDLNIFKHKYEQISCLSEVEPKIENLPVFVEKGVASYSKISQEVNIPQASLKYYCDHRIPENKKILVETIMKKIKKKVLYKLNESERLLSDLPNKFKEMVFVGMVLSNLKSFLNIKNIEFSKSGISLGTINNFFNGVYIPNLNTLKIIVEKVIEKYEDTVSEENYQFLLEANTLANSDIFWEEIKSVEEIGRIDKWVYDLSVENTHNFVANGLIAHNTSLLGALMLEIMSKYRIIALEDTLELPVDSLRKLGYDILRMKVRSALLEKTNELSADEGIRTSLRFGDSCLIVGEVRSKEAQALYEAMRVGALANVVAGTIHGADPYSVFDRVVNDLKVPATSFKATDSILVCNPVKSASGLQSWKRVVQLSEVRKHWEKDPLQENGFIDLLKYNVDKDELEASEDLMNGNSEIIKQIASGVKGWAGNWDAVYDNILLRGKVKKEIVNISRKMKIQELLESKFNMLSNANFYRISDKVREEVGLPVSERVFPEWQKWLKQEARKIKERGKKV